MKLLFKQRFFSLFDMDNFDIYDDKGDRAYVVEGQFSLTHHLKIYFRIRKMERCVLCKFHLWLGSSSPRKDHSSLRGPHIGSQ